MPDFSAEYRRLHVFAGLWVGDDVLHPASGGGEAGAATTDVVARVAVDGRVVAINEVRERHGQVSAAHLVLGYDAHTGFVTLHGVGDEPWSDGNPARGTWDGDTLTLSGGTGAGRFQHQYAFRGPDHYERRVSHWEEGHGWRPRLTGTYHRRTPDHLERYRRQADAIARTYIQHGVAPETAEREAWAVVASLHRRGVPPS